MEKKCGWGGFNTSIILDTTRDYLGYLWTFTSVSAIYSRFIINNTLLSAKQNSVTQKKKKKIS